ncbi:MAG: hypothetical protein FJZ62_04985 [Chlamydiae bacterium]|nr:hypothetical protein [Chlamydiota bacterium]
MGFFKNFLPMGFLASSLLGSSIFCTIREIEFAMKDGEGVIVEKGKGQGIFTRSSDQSVWHISKINGITFWVLEIEFGNGMAKTYFPHNRTDKDHPKICPKNKPLLQEFTDYKSGRSFGSINSKFCQIDGLNGWKFLYEENLFYENNMDVVSVEFKEYSDHTSYIAYLDYMDKEIFLKKK